jgi:hypothetical protein
MKQLSSPRTPWCRERVHEQQRETFVDETICYEHVNLHCNILCPTPGVGWAELPAHSPALRKVGRTPGQRLAKRVGIAHVHTAVGCARSRGGCEAVCACPRLRRCSFTWSLCLILWGYVGLPTLTGHFSGCSVDAHFTRCVRWSSVAENDLSETVSSQQNWLLLNPSTEGE